MKSIRIGILVAVLIAIGYFLAVIVGWTRQEEPLTFGAMGKVSRYNKELVNEEGKAFEDKLKGDKDFRESLIFSLHFMDIRTGEFQANAEVAAAAIDSIKELAELSAKMEKLAIIAGNANEAVGKALENLSLIIAGKEKANAVDYEDVSNNAFLSYLLIDRVKQVGQEFVEAVDSYMDSNKKCDESLVFARDLWVGYGVNDALYNNDKEMMKRWKSKGFLTDEKMSEKFLKQLSTKQVEKIMSGVQLAAVVGKENGKELLGNDRAAIVSAEANENLGIKLDENIKVMASNRDNIENIV
ncbi:MAG: hypothetical protein ACRC8J_01685, partial [Phocaeicola sp.]